MMRLPLTDVGPEIASYVSDKSMDNRDYPWLLHSQFGSDARVGTKDVPVRILFLKAGPGGSAFMVAI